MQRLKLHPTNHSGWINPRNRHDSNTTSVSFTSFSGPPKSSAPISVASTQLTFTALSKAVTVPSVMTEHSESSDFDVKRTAPEAERASAVPVKKTVDEIGIDHGRWGQFTPVKTSTCESAAAN